MTSTKLLNIVQVNLQKAKMAQVEIGRKIKNFNKKNTPFICLVQEPKVSDGNQTHVKNISQQTILEQQSILTTTQMPGPWNPLIPEI